ncbi:DgyrCDS1413 [Dimorphilus gyrociliatus]|uniref:DgyrCDS1413 n=1 Tax=Dimorphilus gyrociliatus TaxID=2664684 RepID=A0A7I8VAF7_9ANNE|nr:DgyrCDS1413 [Dimorphilus gyrociliatus]
MNIPSLIDESTNLYQYSKQKFNSTLNGEKEDVSTTNQENIDYINSLRDPKLLQNFNKTPNNNIDSEKEPSFKSRLDFYSKEFKLVRDEEGNLMFVKNSEENDFENDIIQEFDAITFLFKNREILDKDSNESNMTDLINKLAGEGEEAEEPLSTEQGRKPKKSIASRKSWVDNASLSTVEENKKEDNIEIEVKKPEAPERDEKEGDMEEQEEEDINEDSSIDLPKLICPRSELKSKEAGVRIWLEKNRLKAAKYPISD